MRIISRQHASLHPRRKDLNGLNTSSINHITLLCVALKSWVGLV